MNILLIDTSGPVAGTALMQNGALTHEIMANHGLTHSQTALVLADQAMEGAGLAPGDIDLFAAVVGPGSFTGVRIGVGIVRGLGQATGKPVLGVHALEGLAAGIYEFEGTVCPILDARRGQVYGAAFKVAQGMPSRTMEDSAQPLETYISALPKAGRLLFTGDGVGANAGEIGRILGARALFAPPQFSFLRPGAAIALAHARREEGDSYTKLLPLYLRAPQAERERLAKLEGM